MSPQPARRRRRILIGVGIAVLLIAAAGTVFALTRPGDVSNPDVEFRAEPTDTPVPDATRPPPKGEKDPLDDFVWAHYGYSQDRRRYLPASQNLRPPYYRVWSLTGKVLLEFGPVLGARACTCSRTTARCTRSPRTPGACAGSASSATWRRHRRPTATARST